MTFSVEHLGLTARNPTALKDWYVNVLGGKVIFTGGVTFELHQANSSMKETSDNKLAGLRHVALRMDSIESAKAQLEKSGAKFTETIKPAAGGGHVLFFQDAEGNLLHLVERPTDSPLR
jgi:glyoxylase I family protein